MRTAPPALAAASNASPRPRRAAPDGLQYGLKQIGDPGDSAFNRATGVGYVDLTKYGLGRASPKTFLTHYVATISSSIQSADAQSILDHVQRASSQIAFGLT